MIPPQATGKMIARDGCLMRTGVAVGIEKADVHRVFLSQSKSATHRVVVSHDTRRGGKLSLSVSSPAPASESVARTKPDIKWHG
jgi:hypothetical protein